MHSKFSADVHKSEQLLQEMLVKFFAQNSTPKVFSYEEHTTENRQRMERLLAEDAAEDSRDRYWAERNACPNLYDIGANLEWHLLMNLMSLNPAWRHDGWWCDGVLFFDVDLHIPEPNRLRGLALTYWLTSDETENKSADLTGYALADIELKLIGTEAMPSLAYSISLWVDGHWHWFSETDFAVLPMTSPAVPQPDLSTVERINQTTDDNGYFSFVLAQILEQFAPDSVAIADLSSESETETSCVEQKIEASPDCLRLPLPELLWWLDSNDKKKARRAARGIRDIGPSAKTAAPKLSSVVYDKEADTYLREDCLEALLQIGLDEEEAAGLFAFLVTDSNWGLYSKVEQVLGQARAQAIPIVLQTLKESTRENPLDYTISSSAFAYLKQRKETAFPAFLELLETEMWTYEALRSLHHCGVIAIPKLIELLAHKRLDIRAVAAQALGRIGKPDSAAIRSLKQCFDDPDLLVRVLAIEALGKLGAAALPALLETLETTDKMLLCWGMLALGNLASAAQPATHTLQGLQAENDSTIRYLATVALREIEKESAS